MCQCVYMCVHVQRAQRVCELSGDAGGQAQDTAERVRCFSELREDVRVSCGSKAFIHSQCTCWHNTTQHRTHASRQHPSHTHRHLWDHLCDSGWSKLVIVGLKLVDGVLWCSSIELEGQPVHLELCVCVFGLELSDGLVEAPFANVAPWAGCDGLLKRVGTGRVWGDAWGEWNGWNERTRQQ